MASSPLSLVRMRITSSAHAHTGNAGDGKIIVYNSGQIDAKAITPNNHDGGQGSSSCRARKKN